RNGVVYQAGFTRRAWEGDVVEVATGLTCSAAWSVIPAIIGRSAPYFSAIVHCRPRGFPGFRNQSHFLQSVCWVFIFGLNSRAYSVVLIPNVTRSLVTRPMLLGIATEKERKGTCKPHAFSFVFEGEACRVSDP